ncbi:MAG: hypothetical protein Q8O67_19285 [Deltaproteobacteria bacterium]|nr:hypothetical protein [Deltaproteobacteria bacterium]
MTLIDTSLRRESGCPVHFIWDGNGLGRPFVRLGFLLAVITALLATGAIMAHDERIRAASVVVAGVAGGTWLLGQLLTRFSLFRARAR